MFSTVAIKYYHGHQIADSYDAYVYEDFNMNVCLVCVCVCVWMSEAQTGPCADSAHSPPLQAFQQLVISA